MTPVGFPGPLISSGISYPPPSYYPNCWQWLTASNVVTTGSTVTSWTDSSNSTLPPVGSHAANVTSTNPPHTGSTISGLPAISFNGTSNEGFIQTTVTPEYTQFYQFTIYIVLQITSLPGNDAGIYDNDYNNSFVIGVNNSSGNYYQMVINDPSIGAFYVGPIALSTPTLLVSTFNAAAAGDSGTATMTAYTNSGSHTGSYTFTAPTLSSGSVVVVGGRTSGGGAPGITGLISEVANFTTYQTTAQITALTRYFGKKYSISVP